MSDVDEQWMRLALAEARAAAEAGEVPVGAVVVRHGELVATGRNSPINHLDPTAHAETLALRAAAQKLGNYRLDGCELYVTLEPCAMCSGAILHARLQRVVFGAHDPKTGTAGSVLNLFEVPELNHRTTVQGGILAAECGAPLQAFFKARRVNPWPVREDALRTPDARFKALAADMPPAHYLQDLPTLAGLRLHYLDEGPPDASECWLCLHGPADWSWRYRAQAVAMAKEGRRVIVPDLPGFGRSDKPKKLTAHSLPWHAAVLVELVEHLGLRHVVLLAPATMAPLAAMVAKSHPARVARIELAPEVVLAQQALEAPYPDRGHRAGPLALPRLLAEPGA